MNKKINLITRLHTSTSRNYIKRMINDKVNCMNIAKKYDKNYWDGKRKYGYGGYKYIPGRWKKVAKKLIKKFKLNKKSKILDVGCGKGYLLYEIKKIIPQLKIYGFDISSYGIRNAHPKIKKNLFIQNAIKKFPFNKKYFDLVISINCLHNLKNYELKKAFSEINRVSKDSYIAVESYRNSKELFNLQCWALTCETFLSRDQWIWLMKEFKYNGFYEFIYFT